MELQINIGLDEAHRQDIASGLSVLLADTYTLYLKTHNFHWNVTGPMFTALHALFEEQYTELADAVDVIAERIRALGFKAPGSYREFAALTTIKEAVGNDALPAEAMISELVKSQEAVIRTARSLAPLAEVAGDEVSLDLLTQRLEIHEKAAWMLRSLLN
ncbi:MAG: DNA starvation/stationary phase protection protein [Gammaproteobacteria bacterium]|nr:DNA starvation/stationary phase protection protein [Gammaproteobacteria bacterium]